MEDLHPAILADLYTRTKRDGLLDMVFPGEGKVTFPRFIRHVCGPGSMLVLGIIDGNPQPVGYGWLFESHGVKPEASATFGFAFFREYWGRPELLEISTLAATYWLNQGYRILYAVTLESNALARGFARRAGCKQIANLPHYFDQGGRLVPAIMWAIEKDEFFAAQEGEPS